MCDGKNGCDCNKTTVEDLEFLIPSKVNYIGQPETCRECGYYKNIFDKCCKEPERITRFPSDPACQYAKPSKKLKNS